MQNQYGMDQFDLEAEREGMAVSRFRKEIGESAGRVGTPKQRTRKRSFAKEGIGAAQRLGAKEGLWLGLR